MMICKEQTRARTKDVTRRDGWEDVKVGERLQVVEKAMGLKKGEKMVKICVIEVTNTNREKLRCLTDDLDYGRAEVVREGFPQMTPRQFVVMFCQSHPKMNPDKYVTRLAYKYV